MELLLDSHVALWWAQEPGRLSFEAVQLIAAPVNSVWISAASAWELAIKARSGRLDIDVGQLFGSLTVHGVRALGVGVDDGIRAGLLEWSHRDPFDRLLVAQAQRLLLTIVTRDAAILSYPGVSATGA